MLGDSAGRTGVAEPGRPNRSRSRRRLGNSYLDGGRLRRP